MAGASLFTLLDDIATLLDDIAVMTGAAVKKTAGVLGDDVALNAYQVTGISAQRELPVVWAVAKGSLINKAILVPLALLISALAPWAVLPLLMIGGVYLCFEGVEKILHSWLHHAPRKDLEALVDPTVNLAEVERGKIRGAIRTDFVLSAEIIVISLGSVAAQPFLTQLGVLIAISLIMTFGVYGLVAAIVKLDDVGLSLAQRQGTSGADRAMRGLGQALFRSAPYLLRILSIAGVVAMFLVGGSIVAHAIPAVHDWIHHLVSSTKDGAFLGGMLSVLLTALLEMGVGLLSGCLALLAVMTTTRLWRGQRPDAQAH